jgi:hypothetical protein
MGEEDFAQWVVIWVTAGGVIVTAVGVILSSYYSKISSDKQRKQVSAENVFKINDRLFGTDNSLIQSLLYQESLHGIFPTDENLESKITDYLNDLEMISKFINEDVIETDFADSQFGETLKMAWSMGSIRQFIDNERRNTPDFMDELDDCIINKLKLAKVERN